MSIKNPGSASVPSDESRFPSALYDAAGARLIDRWAITSGIPGFELMQRAARVAWVEAQRHWPSAGRWVIVCGRGNNGGDGFCVAALAKAAGHEVTVWSVGDPAVLTGEARDAYAGACDAGVLVRRADDVAQWPDMEDDLQHADVIVDGLLGIGLSGAPREWDAGVIRAINAAAAPVLALDIPSGLLADTGSAPGEVVQAALTVTFIAMKPGLLTARGPAVCGEIVFDALGVEAAACGAAFPRASLIQPAHVAPCVAPRARDAHKGHHGHVCIIGGDHGMGGAVCMSAEAALRIGAGLVSVVTRPEHVAPLLTRCPEVMARGDEGADALARATVIVIGPGLGRSSWSMDWLTRALASGLPIVIDADALNGLPAALSAIGLARLGPSAVLTPHPGEAARLLDTTAAMVQADRFSAADGLVSRWGGTLVLKGPGTLVLAEGVTPALAAVGNPGMASGGMGDVLAGVIGGLMAQGHPAFLAACAGVWLHGRAADIAAFQGERGLRATDLMAPLRSLVNGGRV